MSTSKNNETPSNSFTKGNKALQNVTSVRQLQFSVLACLAYTVVTNIKRNDCRLLHSSISISKKE